MAIRTRAQLLADQASTLADNTSGNITPAVLRSRVADLADSARLAEDVATTVAPGLMSAADKTKLEGVATGATANDTDAALRARASHTGTQPASTISDFSAAADARIAASNKVSSDVTGITGADQITNMVRLTQAEYDAIGSPNASTFYVVTA